MLRTARYCDGKSSVRSSVCLSLSVHSLAVRDVEVGLLWLRKAQYIPPTPTRLSCWVFARKCEKKNKINKVPEFCTNLVRKDNPISYDINLPEKLSVTKFPISWLYMIFARRFPNFTQELPEKYFSRFIFKRGDVPPCAPVSYSYGMPLGYYTYTHLSILSSVSAVLLATIYKYRSNQQMKVYHIVGYKPG